ncbi:MAG: Ig-like domain-containing protein, partial [Clostridia bacterium]|nr:Ig-like domain-containing protein [Clostridia bacterium]
VDAKESLILKIENFLPTTYNPYFDSCEVSLVAAEGHVIEGSASTNLTDGQIGYSFYSGFTGEVDDDDDDDEIKEVKFKNVSVTVKSLLAGEWTLFVKSDQTEFRLHIVVNAIAPNPIYAEVKEVNDMTEKVNWNRTLTSTNVYQGQEVVFRGAIDHPAYENGNYTVQVTKDGLNVTASCVTLTAVDGLPLYKFSSQELGEYTVSVIPELGMATSFNVTVKEAPDVTSMLVGEFNNADKGYQVTLNPAEEGALSGTATIVKGFDDETETTVISYSYDAETRTFTCAYVSGADGDFVQGNKLPYNYGLMLSDAYKLYLTYESGFSGERVSVLIGGFENSLVCENSIILAKAEGVADKLVANVSGVYRITSSSSSTFITVNGKAYATDEDGNEIKQLSKLGDITLYVGDYIRIWNGLAQSTVTYSIELVETLQLIYVTGVEFEEETAELREGVTLTLNPVFTPADTTQRGLVWTTSDESIATVDDNGVVTGVGAGTVTVTATTSNGKYYASVEITVVGAHVLNLGENTLTFTTSTTMTGGPVAYVFEGEAGKTYTVSASCNGNMGGNVNYDGNVFPFPAKFEISGGTVTLSVSAFSYYENNVTITITEKEEGGVETNFDPIKVGSTSVNVWPNNILYTIVGEPYAKYTVTVDGSTLYGVNNGQVDYGSYSSNSMEYTADANGLADICFFPGNGPGDYVINIVKTGMAAIPN